MYNSTQRWKAITEKATIKKQRDLAVHTTLYLQLVDAKPLLEKKEIRLSAAVCSPMTPQPSYIPTRATNKIFSQTEPSAAEGVSAFMTNGSLVVIKMLSMDKKPHKTIYIYIYIYIYIHIKSETERLDS